MNIDKSDAPTSCEPLNWEELAALAAPEPERINGPTSSQASLRLFGQPQESVRVVLYRDNHGWCPYCQKIWLWLEERQVPYQIRKVSMVCYGAKESWYSRLVPTGLLPALELDGQLITESDRILLALEQAFGPLGLGFEDPAARPLRQLERRLFRAWCQWLCATGSNPDQDAQALGAFERIATLVEEALLATPGPFFLAGNQPSVVDVVFAPFLERSSASLYAYKGYGLRQRHPAIDSWFSAMEARSSYRGTQSDFHTHVHDLPPQMGGCQANGTEAQRANWQQVALGLWPPFSAGPDPETSWPEPPDAPEQALARVLRHRLTLVRLNPDQPERFERALRCALTALVREGSPPPPPSGSAQGLRYLRDRINVPRDMGLHAARRLRRALEQTACLDPASLDSATPKDLPLEWAIPSRHRRDQDPAPFRSATF